jgi:hypothetical protein
MTVIIYELCKWAIGLREAVANALCLKKLLFQTLISDGFMYLERNMV